MTSTRHHPDALECCSRPHGQPFGRPHVRSSSALLRERTASIVLAALGVVFCSAAAHAQVELPERRPEAKPPSPSVDLGNTRRGNIAERVTGKRLYAGRQSPSAGTLELPAQRPTPLAPAPAGSTAPPAAAPAVDPAAPLPSEPATTPAAPVASSNPSSAARMVLDEVAKLSDIHSPMLDFGAQSLAEQGAAGRTAAFQALECDHAPSVLLGARALLALGDEEAFGAVLTRLRSKLPSAAASALVDLVVARDPVRAGPSVLAELLAHKQAGVRSAAQRHLAALGRELPAAALLGALRSKEVDARSRAVTLLAQCEDAGAVPLLLESLTDSSGQVGRRALESLARRADERINGELLRRAFDAPYLLRDQALALVALVEREDARFEALFTDVHRPRLLDGLTSSEPFVSGACAAALIGLGYRGAASEARWYDRDAPHRLVRVVAAQDFASDISTLLPTATRRLALATGVDFGSDGPRWMSWWAQNAENFRCARARLEVGEQSALELELSVRSSRTGEESFTLLGPAWADPQRPPRAVLGERFFLTQAQARGAFEELRRLGVFGAERLPGLRGSPSSPARALTVAFEAASKQFSFPDGAGEPWFLATLELMRGLRERNLWQLLHDPRSGVSAEDFWRDQASWWDSEANSAARARRLWELTAARAKGQSGAQRDVLVERLVNATRDVGPLSRADSELLVGLLSEEAFYGARAERLLELVVQSLAVDGALADAEVERLTTLLFTRFGAQGGEALARVLGMASAEQVLARSRDERHYVRAVSALVLARRGDDAALARLLELVRDTHVDVRAAALLALGDKRVEAARDVILVEARVGEGELRLAALRAAGRLGGDGALSALLDGLSDEADPRVRVAAAQGLSLLRDRGAAPILISLLARGPEDPAYVHAREGLKLLGDAGHEELLRVVRTSSHKARREATLILSEQLSPQCASVLMTLLSEDPSDARVAEELAVLTAVDYRGDATPSASWWAWWDYVVHDDAQAWLSGAIARLQLGAPTPEELRSGSPAAVELLLELCGREETHLVERARRELSRLAGRDLGRIPPRGRERDAWRNGLRDALANLRR